MHRAFPLATILTLACLSIAWATSAVADSPQLSGAYGFTGTAACLPRLVT